MITSYVRETSALDPDQPIFAYIEGDGLAWLTKTRLSTDPTPNDPVALKLAALDPQPNVIYIARPCQFTALSLDPNCQAKYWSEARYSIPVVAAIEEVLENFQTTLQAMRNNSGSAPLIHLIGYSGGGTIAGLIATRRSDILTLRTIAGNLDHEAVSQFHQTTKLDQSLNLMDLADQLKNLPQIHYLGANDQIIPKTVVQSFVAKVNASAANEGFSHITPKRDRKCCAKSKLLPDLDHYHGWEDVWRQVKEILPSCYS